MMATLGAIAFGYDGSYFSGMYSADMVSLSPPSITGSPGHF